MAQLESVLQQALALGPEDRALLAEALEQSLSGSDGVLAGESFLAELRRRSRASREGTMSARPAEEVLADLRERQLGASQS